MASNDSSPEMVHKTNLVEILQRAESSIGDVVTVYNMVLIDVSLSFPDVSANIIQYHVEYITCATCTPIHLVALFSRDPDLTNLNLAAWTIDQITGKQILVEVCRDHYLIRSKRRICSSCLLV